MPPRTGWLGISELLTPKRPPTPLERQAIAEVHELALRFATAECSVKEIQAATTPKQRNLATRYTTPKQAEWRPMMAMLDALIASERDVAVTKQGTFLLSDLIAAGMRILRDAGREVLQFPRVWPWRTKPDPDHGVEGVRGEPFYRSLDQRGPVYGNFGNPQPNEIKPEWWQELSTEEVPF